MALMRKGDVFLRVEPVPEGKRYPPGTKKKDRDQYRLVTYPGGEQKVKRFTELLEEGFTVWSV